MTTAQGSGVVDQITGKVEEVAGQAGQATGKTPVHTAERLRSLLFTLHVVNRSRPKAEKAFQGLYWKGDQAGLVEFAANEERWTAKMVETLEELSEFPKNINVRIGDQDCNAEKGVDAIIRGGRELLRKEIVTATKGMKVLD